jgi:pilus assembly protein CpaE
MNQAIKTLVALDTNVSYDMIQAALPVDTSVQVVGMVEGLDEAWNTLQETNADLLVVACGGYSDRALYLIEGAVRQKPSRPVVVLTQASPNGFVRRVFEVGADDVVVLPETQDGIKFALQKALARKTVTTGAGSLATAPLIAVLGPKGGTGKTLVSTNLSVALAVRGRKVAVVDLDLQFGDVGLCLGLSPERTIYDLVKAGGSIDADKVEGYMTQHPSGVRALLAPSRPDQAASVSVELLRDIYSVLRATYDYVVIDTPPGFTPEVIATIDSASDVCLVGMLDSLSLKNTKLGLETLDLMGFDSDHLQLVLNRAGSRVGITAEDVRSVIGRNPDVLIPSDREIPRAVNEGQPIVVAKPSSEAAKSFSQLADRFVAADANANGAGHAGRRRSLFSRKG